MSLYHELKRRNVFRVAIAYLALAWLLTEVSGTLFPAFGIPDWSVRFVVIVFALGFAPALIISWVYEITPEGIKREKDVVRNASITHLTAKRLDVFTIGLIVVALAFILADRLWLSPRLAGRSAAPVEVVTNNVQNSEHESQYPSNSIAVLPFVNMSDDEANEYFSDGISEELLNLLAKIPELQVAARTSSFSFKEQNLEITEIAKRLKVAHVLEGSVRKAANQVRITAQLIKADDGYHLWSKSYDRTLDDIFAIQDEIAAEVVSALKVTLLDETASRARETDPEAYNLFLQGRYFGMLGTAESYRKAEELLRQALARDPGFAPAWERLGNIYINQAVTGLIEYDQGYQQARTYTLKVLDLDPGFAYGHSQRAWIAMEYEHDLASAAVHLQRALALAPNDAKVLGTSANLASILGRLDLAVELSNQALAMDPLSPIHYGNTARHYILAGKLDEAEKMYDKALALSPGDVWVLSNLARLYLHQSRPDEALATAELVGVQKRRLWIESMAYYDLGQAEASDTSLVELKEDYAENAANYIAQIHAWRGELDSAIEWLNRAADESLHLGASIPFDPAFQNLHDDPRWLPFLKSLGKSPAQLDVIDFEVNMPE
jgi:TolB-like protein/Tfp pilus assembly protein PilF